MAGKFRKYAVASTAEALYQMYYFIASSGQNVVEIYSDGGTPAVYKQGTGYVASFASSADTPAQSYFVVRSVAANGGVRWYARFKNDTGNVLKVTFSPDGTWSNGGAGPGSFTGTQTNETQFNDAAAPGVGSFIWCGANTVSYNGGGSTYTYLWFNVQDSGDATAKQFCYVGGFVPFNPATDTKPACLLARQMGMDNTTDFLGCSALGATCLSRAAVEYAHSTSWLVNGYARVGISDVHSIPGNTVANKNIGGEYISMPVYLWANTGGVVHGHFSDHLLSADVSKTDYDTNTGLTYVVLGHFFVYYNEAL